MMGAFGYGNGMMGSFGLFGLLTWLAMLTFLILGSMFFWKELNKSKRK